MLRSVLRTFCKNIQPLQPQLANISHSLPVHLRPYDPVKYEKLNPNPKRHSGYAVLQVDPMPRASIMKLCYNFMQRLKQVPQGKMYRLYHEQRLKYIMKITDQTESVEEIERKLNETSIQYFIYHLKIEFENIDYWLREKPWDMTNTPEEIQLMREAQQLKQTKPIPKYVRGGRFETQFIGR